MGKSNGGSYVPQSDYTRTGATDTGGTYASATLTSPTVTGATISGTLASPAITGTVTGGASYTAPTLTSPTVTGTTTIGTGATITAPAIVGATITGTVTVANGSTITTPVLSGTVTGTYTLGGTPTLASAAGVPYVGGVAASYRLARSASPVAVTGTSDITTGLTTVVAAGAGADSDFDGTNLAAVQAVITGGAGHILLKAWKITAADNGALIAATGAKNLSWWAIGT